MTRIFRKLQNSIVFLLKILLYLWIIACFYLIMSIENWQLLVINRTSGVTLLTFVAVGLGMISTYGNYDIGKRKSKQIVSSLALATAITDIITDLQLSIMNTNAANGLRFSLANIGLLFPVFFAQLAGIFLFTYGGNWLYFRINRPERCCVVTSSKESFLEIYKAAENFKRQYKIDFVRDYREKDLFQTILKCDTVFLYDLPVDKRTELIEFCYRNMINILFNPEIADIVEINAKHTIIDDVSMISAPVKELSFEQRFFKRLMDIVISALALIILSPVMLICAIAIKTSDGGSVIFKQQRATKDGRIFNVYKFRTMREDVETYPATEADGRVTQVGRVLRKFRLDELPQLLNILKGEMSLVGPRPEMLRNIYVYTKEYPEFEYRLRVKAGLTGYAQIAGKYNTTPKYKLILDLMYIENYSLVRDLKLLLQTLIVFFKPDSTEGFAKKMDDDISKYESMMDIKL